MFKSAKNLIIIVFVLMAILLVADFILAAGPDLGMEYGEATGLGETDPREIAANIIRIALAFLGVIAVILIMYGGFVWMTAAGNQERIERAKKILVSAIIGLIIILSAFAIATFLLNKLLIATGPPGPGPGPPPIPPPPIPDVTCDSNTLTPECDADDNICTSINPNYYCSLTSCLCRNDINGYPCDGDEDTPECEAEDSICTNLNPDYYCSPTSCQCRRSGGLYDPCNATTTQGVCEPIIDGCNFDLTCDTTDCFCKDFPVIKWISPEGGFCDDDPNIKCQTDADCASTCNTDTPNAAPGNIITIGGRYFGTTTGDVMFWDGTDFNIPGLSPSTLNPNCDSNWQSDQIIIVVPLGAITGPVRVIRARDSQSDDTNDIQGPIISDLVINSIVKPGLCKLDPDEGLMGDNIDYHGVNFSVAGGLVRFGSHTSFVAGGNPNFLSDTEAEADVPNIETGLTTSFVVGSGGERSNYLRFRKLREMASGPYIVSFEPTEGPSLQYVTIYGSGFGYARGSSRVYFGDEISGFEASYDFPDICADSVWNDDQIIVKVPEGINDANYAITIVLGTDTIDTSGVSPSTFRVDNSLVLSPCLCRVSPVIGQAGNLITLWGEYFEDFDLNSRVRFYSDNNVFGAGIDFWDLDPDNESRVDVYKVETTIHPETVTGPVRVVRGSPEIVGNGLNLQIGSCLDAVNPDQACGADICCAADTYKAGRCALSVNDCFMDIPSSVYEWDFSTSPATGTSDDSFSSCAEKSRILGTCDPEICPNSYGQCSFYTGGEDEEVGDCSFLCEVDECAGSKCTYNSNIDRCATTSACSLPIIVKDVYGQDIDAYCASYLGISRRVIYVGANSSCPTNWRLVSSLGIDDEIACVDPASTCSLCQSDFVCLDDNNGDDIGLCGIPNDICPSGAVCENDDKCRRVGDESCECCCRILSGNEDCCFPLRCESDCGSDKNADTNTFGYCSGCRVDSNGDGNIDAAEQTLSDNACNCDKASGKYCDVNAGEDSDNDGYPDGICRDCGELDETNCSIHPAACCVDAMSQKECRGGAGNFNMVASDNLAYCEYFQCTIDNMSCDTLSNPVAVVATVASGTRYFDTDPECQTGCNPLPILGLSCASKGTNTCNTIICSSPFSCMNEDGHGPVYPDDCGVCCCDPGNDQCNLFSADYPNLICQPDKAPCSSPERKRGLCCGCEENINCGNINQVGCGSDTCCRARPSVSTTTPADDAIEVCTNAEIRAEFNQLMDINSFSSNVIVVGEHSGTCPEGTVYLAKAGSGWEDKNIVVKTIYRVINFFREPLRKMFGRNALASDPPVATMNYCAITGSVTSEHLGENRTILRFQPLNLMDTERKYYVIVRGDIALSNQTGVLSFWQIGMNAAGSPVDNTASFNGIIYSNAHIWSFVTLSDQNSPNGICEIDHAVVSPSSYLFQTVINNLNEEDNDPTNMTFDTIRDRDKKFTAYALSTDNQILVPVSGYAWNWIWNVVDTSVARINPNIFDTDEPNQLVEADPGASDKATKLKAKINLTQDSYSTKGHGEIGDADIRVFICENPWPPIRSNGTWYPWLDTNTNCIPTTGLCLDTNYAIYYCRDQGKFGTQDDLPAILSEAVTRGANQDLLKESYFFREETPDIEDAALIAAAIQEGEAVEFSWSEIFDPLGVDIVDRYKLYWATDSGVPYSEYIEVDVGNAPYVSGNSWFRLEGLDNNTTYYFSVTAIYETGGESDYSNEVEVLVDDVVPPPHPIALAAILTNATTTISVSWQFNFQVADNDTAGYRLYYGHDSRQYGYRAPASDDSLILGNTESFIIGNQKGTYYITVTGVDEEGNESPTSSSPEIIMVVN